MLLYNVWSFYRLYAKGIIDVQVPQSTNVLDKWVLSKLYEAHREVSKYMDAYNTVSAGRVLTEFINELSTWYVRRSRDRMKEDGEAGRSALSVLGYVLAETSKLLAPLMPFLSEFIYKDVTGKESVHLETWSAAQEVDQALLDQMDVVREVVSVGLAARKLAGKSVRQPLGGIAFTQKEKTPDIKDTPELLELLTEELNIKTVVAAELLSAKEQKTQLEGTRLVTTVLLDLEMTEVLKAEGLARELERQIQDLRKKSGLKVGELVDLYYNTQDVQIEAALTNLIDRKKTFVSQVAKSLEVEVEYETQTEIDGKAVWLGFIKV
jgi:isoleucyl-tRNA synthetase